jgi:hypothetical protein
MLSIAISMMLVFPPKSEIPKLKLRELKFKLAAEQQLMAKARSLSNKATISPFKVSNLIDKNENEKLREICERVFS